MSQILTIEVPSVNHRYAGDSMRCAAYTHALHSGETGVCLVLVKRPDYDPIQVVVNVKAKEASIVLPLPASIKELAFGTVFSFPDEMIVVTEHKPEEILAEVRTLFPDFDAGIVTLNRETASIQAADYSSDPDQPIMIGRSTEAAAAAAMVLHQDLENGTMESTIGQPGGVLEIGMRKENGKVTGLSAGGPVDFS